LAETERLLALPQVKSALARNRAKVRWIQGTITDVRVALEDFASFTQRVKGDTDRGSWVGLRNRAWWLLEEYEKLVHRRMEVSTSHAALLEVMTYLGSFEPLACCYPDGDRYGDERLFEETGDESRYVSEEREQVRFADGKETTRQGAEDENLGYYNRDEGRSEYGEERKTGYRDVEEPRDGYHEREVDVRITDRHGERGEGVDKVGHVQCHLQVLALIHSDSATLSLESTMVLVPMMDIELRNTAKSDSMIRAMISLLFDPGGQTAGYEAELDCPSLFMLIVSKPRFVLLSQCVSIFLLIEWFSCFLRL
jgi:hypothetical protein